MLGQHSGDVVVHHDHLVHVPVPLPGEHADGGRAAAGPHAPLLDAVHQRRAPGLRHHRGPAVDGQLHRLAVAQREQRLAGDPPGPAGAAGELVHPADGEHLRAVLGGGDVPDRLALGADGGAFRAEMAVGVDFHLRAAVGEDALGDHGDRVHAFVLGGDDERRWLVVGVGGARADAGDEGAVAGEGPAVPVGDGLAREGHDRGARVERPLGEHQGIGAHQAAVLVGVAVAGAELPGLDAAQDGAGVAAHDPGFLAGAELAGAGGAGGGRSGAAGEAGGSVGAGEAGVAAVGTAVAFGPATASGRRGFSHDGLPLQGLRARGHMSHEVPHLALLR